MTSKRKRWERAYHSQERVDWIQAMPCIACGAGPCENHHTRGGGVGRKADWETVVPLCAGCHRECHQVGTLTFQFTRGVDFAKESAFVARLWNRRHTEDGQADHAHIIQTGAYDLAF